MSFSGHFLLLPKPSGSPSNLLAVATAAAGDFFQPTFSACSSLAGDLIFRGARGRSTRRRKPFWQTVAHAPPRADLLRRIESHVSARDPLSGAVLLIHPSDGPPRAFLLHLFWQFRFRGTFVNPLRPSTTALSLCRVLCVH